MTSAGRRLIGIFGGSFDPPHLGHLICARAVAEKLSLEKVIVIPAATQPLKPEGTFAPADTRLRMLEVLFGNEPNFEISRIELERGGNSYTIDTLNLLHESYPEPEYELVLILGLDALCEIQTWKTPDLIFKRALIAAMTRPGTSLPRLKPDWERRIIVVSAPSVEISSSDIRHRIANGISVTGMVSSAVMQIISREKLYSC